MRRKRIHSAARRLLAAALILLLGAAAGFALATPTPAQASDSKSYTLYLPAADSHKLVPVAKNLTLEKDRALALNDLVKALFSVEPSQTESATSLQMGLRQVFLDRAGTAYVDLTAPDRHLHASDAAMERLYIWSIVNTLCYNSPDVQQVKVLVGGDEAETLFGHVDLSRPLLPDPRLIEKNDR